MSDNADGTDIISRKFKFKVKITQTDLFYDETFFRMMTGNSIMSSFPMMSQHSSYISKLNFINSYEGGTVAGYSGNRAGYENCGKSANSRVKKADKSKRIRQDEVGNNVFRVSIADPEIAEEVRVKKEKFIREKVAERILRMQQMQQTDKNQKANADESENEWLDIIDWEDIDIIASLNAREQLNNAADTDTADVTNVIESNTDDSAVRSEYDGYDDDYDDYGGFGDYDNYDNYDDTDREYADEADYIDDYEDYEDEAGTEQNALKQGELEIKFDATGSIRFLSDNLLEVKYDESEMTGIKDSYVRFLFDMNKKNFVSINRGEETDIWLDCEKGKRISHQKLTRHSGVVVTICTKKLINKMTPDGGQLYIQYIRETDGSPSEMVTHSLSAIPVRE